ncbi:MAG: hypothetical protein WD226_06680 [Planctomycetota bacterium]
MKHLVSLGAFLVLASSASSQLAPDQFLVASKNTDEILRYSSTTGQFVDVFVPAGSGGLSGPEGMVLGPDGDLYVASTSGLEILRYDGSTGAFQGVVLSFTTNLFMLPITLAFGPDGLLYIAGKMLSSSGSAIIKHDVNGVVPSSLVYWSGFIAASPTELQFGPDQRLYVSTIGRGIVRIDTETNGIVDNFIPFENSWTHNLMTLRSAEFGPDGLLYTHEGGGRQVKRYDGSTGAFVDQFWGPEFLFQLGTPQRNAGLVFDANGDLLVSLHGGPDANRIGHYDGATGDLIRIIDPTNVAGLDGPAAIVLPPRIGTTYGCLNPANSLTALAGLPRLGSTFTLGVDDPTGATAIGSPALLILSRQRLGAYPCGVILPGLGFGGGAGELLVNMLPPDPLDTRVSSTLWTGPGNPVPVDLAVPPLSTLVGRDVFVQGALFDVAGSTGNRFGLTNAMAIRFTL